MDIFLVNQDNPHARSLCRKLAKQSKPGAIIPLTDGEMSLYRSNDFQHVLMGADKNPMKITELKPEGTYVFVCADRKVILDDVIQTKEALLIQGIDISIIRVNS